MVFDLVPVVLVLAPTLILGAVIGVLMWRLAKADTRYRLWRACAGRMVEAVNASSLNPHLLSTVEALRQAADLDLHAVARPRAD